MKVIQKETRLQPKSRGFHLITSEIEAELPELKEISAGILNVFIKHTSAGLTINENADPTVREDFESHINKMVPENMPYYKHTYEGADDMPAHIKSSLTQTNLSIPIENFQITLGTWQGIYLFEHRTMPHTRIIKLHLIG